VGHFSSSNYGVEKAAPLAPPPPLDNATGMCDIPTLSHSWKEPWGRMDGGAIWWRRTDKGSQTLMERGRCCGVACF